MSGTLVVAIPLALLGVVALLGFVGCVLDVSGLPPAFQTYTPDTSADPNCVAYWPLNEPSGSIHATDIKGNNTGDYLNPTTAPDLYPWGSANFGEPSAAAGAMPFLLGQTGIVIGDLVPNTTNRQPCMVVDGALVRVPFAGGINPNPEFTVEAWVRVDWSGADEAAQRAVLNCHDINPVATGFAIIAEVDASVSPPTYRWNAEVGDGTAGGFAILGSTSALISLNEDSSGSQGPTTYYLALTYNGTTLNFYINGSSVEKKDTAYAPNTTQPLYIGAGAPFEGMRPSGKGPLFPFKGAIQDVAIYNKALTDTDIARHNTNGNGDVFMG